MIQTQRRPARSNLLPQVVFLCLTFIAAASGTFLVLRLFGDAAEGTDIPQIITVEIVITATPLPTKAATPAPASDGRAQLDLPPDIAAEARDAPGPAIAPEQLGARDAALSTPTVAVAGGPVLAQNCYHSVVSGDTPYGLALRYDVPFDLMLEVNNISVGSATNIQIGEILRVPLPGCQFDGIAIPAAPDSAAAAATAQPTPTSTPVAPEIEIIAAEGIGDVTAEAIRLINRGGTINISGWTLADSDGHSFTFRETMIFPQGALALYTRSGTSTADARFWNLEEAAWEVGENLTLSDELGRVVLTLEIPGS